MAKDSKFKHAFENSEFRWKINNCPRSILDGFNEELEFFSVQVSCGITGILATTDDPVPIESLENMTVDLYVNGCLKVSDILFDLETESGVESFLFGQIHCDIEDLPENECFEKNSEYQRLVEEVQDIVFNQLSVEWEIKRIISGKHRPIVDIKKIVSDCSFGTNPLEVIKSEKFMNISVDEKIKYWNGKTQIDSNYIMDSFIECYLIENFLKLLIEYKKINIDGSIFSRNKQKESDLNLIYGSKTIRKNFSDSHYLNIDELNKRIIKYAKGKGYNRCDEFDKAMLHYELLRDVVAHTGLLSVSAKRELEAIGQRILNIGEEILQL